MFFSACSQISCHVARSFSCSLVGDQNCGQDDNHEEKDEDDNHAHPEGVGGDVNIEC